MMTQILSADPAIEVIAAASDPFAAARYIKDELPDVITLDVEMPHGRHHLPAQADEPVPGAGGDVPR
jgi:chemotaxis response regulator CheB